jgi:hypothetical protein
VALDLKRNSEDLFHGFMLVELRKPETQSREPFFHLRIEPWTLKYEALLCSALL